MKAPTVIEAASWVAACRPDGGHMTFTEAADAIRQHGLQFDNRELRCDTIMQLPGDRWQLTADTDEGVLAWVLLT